MKARKKNPTLQSRLRKEMSSLGERLNESLRQVLLAMEEQDTNQARKLIPELNELKEQEDTSHDLCLQILTFTQGNADQIRWTNSAHKILSLMKKSSTEIEEIAHKLTKIEQAPAFPLIKDLPEMGRVANGMLQKSIHAALEPDVDFALGVIEADSSLDRSREHFMDEAVAFLSKNPDATPLMVPYLFISQHLERIGDHASHIAEEVVYYLHDRSDGRGTSGCPEAA